MLIVLWAVVLIGLLVMELSATGRFQSRIAANEVTSGEAEAAADGGVHVAVFHLGQAGAEPRWFADGVPRSLSIGRCQVTVRVWSEAGKINPNRASPKLLASLFRVLGADPGRADALASAIGSWRDPSAELRSGPGLSAYRAVGKDYGPPGEPIETIDELGRVLGMTPDLLALTKPHLSLWTLQDDPSRVDADPVVARALEGTVRSADKVLLAAGPTRRMTVTVRAVAAGPDGGRFIRRAVLRIGSGSPSGFQVLSWDRDFEE